MKSFFKKKHNGCLTYFRIVGNFNPEEVTEKLGLKPFSSWKIGDKRLNGGEYDFAAWHFGECKAYSQDVNEQLKFTVEPLLDKVELLNEIREANDVKFYLEVVSYLYRKNLEPSLAPSLEIMDFCTAVRCEMDIDMYID